MKILNVKNLLILITIFFGQFLGQESLTTVKTDMPLYIIPFMLLLIASAIAIFLEPFLWPKRITQSPRSYFAFGLINLASLITIFFLAFAYAYLQKHFSNHSSLFNNQFLNLFDFKLMLPIWLILFITFNFMIKISIEYMLAVKIFKDIDKREIYKSIFCSNIVALSMLGTYFFLAYNTI